MAEKSEIPVAPSDIRWVQDQITRLERRFRILIDLLVAKKVIDEATAKIFWETKSSNEELLKWYLENIKKKEK